MKALVDPGNTLGAGLAAMHTEFQLPSHFPPDVEAAAAAAAGRLPTDHDDWIDTPFVTLDPASSTDLDQAFAIERADGDELLLHYAIADVAWFVEDGDPVDSEAWARGMTVYLPDGKVPLYPTVLSQGAASLLPNGERPAVIFTVRCDAQGAVRLDGVTRAVIRSRAKLAYETVRPDDLPRDFEAFARRIQAAEDQRGAARVDPPEQEVEALADGRLALRFRPRLASEDRNAALSLATNMAIADALQAHGTGLFRVMAEPDEKAVNRLRHTASALGISWPEAEPLTQFERSLDAARPADAALMLAIRRAGDGASYAPYRDGVTPWHAAMAATYAHASAPLRRLADRYVVRAALAIANGQPVPLAVSEAFEKLPPVMAKAEALAGQVEQAVIDLAEAVMLQGHPGESLRAVVTDIDPRGARVQLLDYPIVARVDTTSAKPGDSLTLKLDAADPQQRRLTFSLG